MGYSIIKEPFPQHGKGNMIVNINKEFAIRCQRKRITCNGFLTERNYPR